MRFYGAVGYAQSVETAPGVWGESITEVMYYGEVVRDSRALEPPPTVPPETNPVLSLENSFSIVADAHAYNNYTQIRYVSWLGSKWQVTHVEVDRPRLNLTVGGLWHGNTP